MTTNIQLTEASQQLFDLIIEDAPNWSGTPLLGGNFDTDEHTNGNLTDLKVKGLITTFEESEPGRPALVWIDVTDLGLEYAGKTAEEIGSY